MKTTEFIFSSIENDIGVFTVSWRTPSNIALVKYWGKTNLQIPKNPSISFTLDECHTTTKIDFEKKTLKEIDFELFFEGKRKDDFKPKIHKFFERIKEYCPYVLDYKMTIYSENSFPHSSGIASSASGMSAIAMCLISLEKYLKPSLSDDFYNCKASFIARLGSGSASRSVEGPLVVWGENEAIENSSNLYGIKFPYEVAPIFKDYQDSILLVDKGQKQVSSTVGHDLMFDHPFAGNRFKQANENLEKITEILRKGDVKSFIALVESEALTLHAMMLTSSPYFILMKPKTLEIINRIWEYRNANSSNVCFTLDAGANVHVLYPENEKEEIQNFIEKDLACYCQNGQFIHDNVGLGAKLM